MKPVLKAVNVRWRTSCLLARCKTDSVIRAAPVDASSRLRYTGGGIAYLNVCRVKYGQLVVCIVTDRHVTFKF
jgi:hypothetical protein